MQDLWNIALKDRIISRISRFLGNNTYLVGGCVRDLLMNKPSKDYDIVTFTDVWALAQKVASHLEAKAFWMDKSRQIARIAFPSPTDLPASGRPSVLIDISAPKGPDIVSDLKGRDITVNAMALDLLNKELIDPLKGVEDLKAGIIRITSEGSIVSDPLRILRCLRFAAMFCFNIETHTLDLLKQYASDIETVSPERIKQELMSAIDCSNGSRMFYLMEEIGLIDILFPQYRDAHGMSQGRHHKWPLLKHVLLTTSEIDSLIEHREEYLPGIGDYLSEEIEYGITRAGLLRLAAFLHDIGKPETKTKDLYGNVHFYGHTHQGTVIASNICKKLKFSTKSIRTVEKIVETHMRLLDLSTTAGQCQITDRAIYRLLSQARGIVPEMLLHAIADATATGKDPAYTGSRACIETIVSKVWNYYICETKKMTPLINGYDVMQTLGCPPGPQVGMYLRMVEEARAEGIVLSRDDAVCYLHTIKDGR
ncbi:MAG: CCA tRNA nucleotidyltransferase [Deltaproteobacteria bacterium]|nr:CCA tRNA nucleotidyltransferase [Deltaproteobacteria bacterium]